MAEQGQGGDWQKPSVGRIVHYVSHGTPPKADGSQAYESQCRSAMVTQVNNPTDLGLCVINPTGLFFHTSVKFGGADKQGGTWHWPERT